MPIVSKVRIVMEICGHLCEKNEKELLYARSSISDELKVIALKSSKMGKHQSIGDVTHLGPIISIMPQLCFRVPMEVNKCARPDVRACLKIRLLCVNHKCLK